MNWLRGDIAIPKGFALGFMLELLALGASHRWEPMILFAAPGLLLMALALWWS